MYQNKESETYIGIINELSTDNSIFIKVRNNKEDTRKPDIRNK
jgi:hypothetical protein